MEKLIARGLVAPAGMEKIEMAKQQGNWHKLDGIEAFAIPTALQKAMEENEPAKKFFETLSNTNRKYILYYINNAKRESTRAQRIAEIIAAANENKMHERFIVARKPVKK